MKVLSLITGEERWDPLIKQCWGNQAAIWNESLTHIVCEGEEGKRRGKVEEKAVAAGNSFSSCFLFCGAGVLLPPWG